MSDLPSVELCTARTWLVLPGEDEAGAVLRYYQENREHLERWSPPLPDDFYTLRYWRKRLDHARREYAEDRALRLIICERDEPEREPGARRVIGTCSFTDIVRGPSQACKLGYGLARTHEGRGLMAEALRAALDFAFETLALHRVEANYMPSNERSGALLRRLGFDVVGYARDYLFISGAWRDHILTALTNPKPRPPGALPPR
jgi:[ribosomal protein S5]-alanine N-acetyltransferase